MAIRPQVLTTAVWIFANLNVIRSLIKVILRLRPRDEEQLNCHNPILIHSLHSDRPQHKMTDHCGPTRIMKRSKCYEGSDDTLFILSTWKAIHTRGSYKTKCSLGSTITVPVCKRGFMNGWAQVSCAAHICIWMITSNQRFLLGGFKQ